MKRWFLFLLTLTATGLGAPPASAQDEAPPARPGPASDPPHEVARPPALSEQLAGEEPAPAEEGWWAALGLSSRPPSSTNVRSAGVKLTGAFAGLSPAGAGLTLEQRFTEHVWGTASAYLSTYQQVPIGREVNVNNYPAQISVNGRLEPGLRFVVNPGDAVELFGAGGVTAAAGAQVNRRDMGFWNLLPGGDPASSWAGSSVRVGAWTALGAELGVLEALRLRFTVDLLTAGGSFDMGGDATLTSMFFDGARLGSWASLALSPSLALHLRF